MKILKILIRNTACLELKNHHHRRNFLHQLLLYKTNFLLGKIATYLTLTITDVVQW